MTHHSSNLPPVDNPGLAKERVQISLGLAGALMRIGVIVGLWPVLLSPDGLILVNLIPLLVHLFGSVATVFFVVRRHRVMQLVGIAFTGYSTVALALGAPTGPALIIWAVGVGALLGLLLAAMCKSGRPGRWSWFLGSALGTLTATGLTSLWLLTAK